MRTERSGAPSLLTWGPGRARARSLSDLHPLDAPGRVGAAPASGPGARRPTRDDVSGRHQHPRALPCGATRRPSLRRQPGRGGRSGASNEPHQPGLGRVGASTGERGIMIPARIAITELEAELLDLAVTAHPLGKIAGQSASIRPDIMYVNLTFVNRLR